MHCTRHCTANKGVFWMGWCSSLGMSLLWTESLNNAIVILVVTFIMQAEEVHAVGFYGWIEKGYILRSVFFYPFSWVLHDLTDFTCSKRPFLVMVNRQSCSVVLSFPSMTVGRRLREKSWFSPPSWNVDCAYVPISFSVRLVCLVL